MPPLVMELVYMASGSLIEFMRRAYCCGERTSDLLPSGSSRSENILGDGDRI